jgi:predicted RNA polymerase sigma factor
VQRAADRGIEELRAIAERDRLESYSFYPTATGEREPRRENRAAAWRHFKAALHLARNPAERRFLEKRVSTCDDAQRIGPRRSPPTGTVYAKRSFAARWNVPVR